MVHISMKKPIRDECEKVSPYHGKTTALHPHVCNCPRLQKKITNNVADQSRTKSLRRTASHSIVTF